MQVTFGLQLDGEHGWRPADRLGEPVVGPLGFLNLLETRLGLLRADCPQAQRVTQYRECLERADAPGRCYHASFGVDPIGTAAALLSWRDLWYLHGWDGEPPPGAGPRIADLAVVETSARMVLFPSVGERLIAVADALSKRKCGIQSVEVVDPIEAFPNRWRDVLGKLPVRAVRPFRPSADATTVLGKLQNALVLSRQGKKPDGKIPWSGDGSLCVVQADTGLVAARWIAHAFASRQGEVAIVAERNRSLLDATFDAVDIARQGLQDPNSFVPALQVLPLALAVVWEPLDVYALLEFLTHPIGPVPGYARRRLAETIAESPGIGGPRWLDTIAEIERRVPERAADTRKAIAFWAEHPRYSPAQGAPLTVLIERSRGIRDYYAARLADQDPVRSAAAGTGYAQTSAVTAALETFAAQGQGSLSREALQALVSQCTAGGARNSAMHAQVGCVPSACEPGAMIEPFDRVIWWQMGAPALPGHYPWSRSEIAALSDVGVDLPPLAGLLQQRSQAWLRPILAARKQLVLVLPPPGEELHPLWQEIDWFVEGVRPEPLEELLTGRTATDLPEVAHAPLPERRRWWSLPAEAKIPPRPSESYSSLNAFLNVPYQWVLKYAAQLNPSNLLAVADGNLLYGSLAHRLIDRFFRDQGTHTLHGDALMAWFSHAFDSVVAEEGAVLLMPGRRADYERLRGALGRALSELQRQFASAGVNQVESERSLFGKFPGGKLEGHADLVVRNAAGQRAIVDMKWAGGTRYQDSLERNRHLQLAIYAEMLRQEMGAWPQVSYFILSSSRLLAPDAGFFPGAQSVQSNASASTALLWQQFIAAWTWRRSQLDAGLIEVAIDGIEPTADSVAPPDALEPQALPEAYSDYRWLAGWES